MQALLLSLPLLLATGSPGDQLKRERLPASVDFVMHLDFEGLKQTQLWKLAQQEKELDLDLEELGEIEQRFGLNPLTDVRAVTLYKVEQEEDPTVVLLSTSAKVDAALAKLQQEDGYQRLSEGKIELHTWKEASHDDESVFAYLFGSGDERVVVLASNKASALRAARVLRGEEISLAKAGTGLKVAPAAGSFLYMSAAGLPDMDEFAPASQVLGLAQGLQFDVGEAGGFLKAHLGIVAADADKAFHISTIANGAISTAYLLGAKLGDALELLTGLRVRNQGADVTMDFEFELERLVEIVRSLSHGEDDDGEEPEHVEPVDRTKNEKVRPR